MDPLAELAAANAKKKSISTFVNQRKIGPSKAKRKLPYPMVLAIFFLLVILCFGAWLLCYDNFTRITAGLAGSTTPPFKIEGDNSKKEFGNILFKFVSVSEKPLRITRISYNGEHDEIPESMFGIMGNVDALPWNMTIGEVRILQQVGGFDRTMIALQGPGDAAQNAASEEFYRRHEYDKIIIFLDIDTSLGNFRYHLDSGKIEPR